MSAQEVYANLGASSDVIRALVRAEKYGRAIVQGVIIICTGYSGTAQEFCAATAIYVVRY